jgi:hypothetical protein
MYKEELFQKIINYAKKHYRREEDNLFGVAYSPRQIRDNFIVDSLVDPSSIKPGPTFSVLLFRFIDKKEFDEVLLYKTIQVSRAHFSKIRSNLQYQPTIDTVFKFIIGLKLALTESNILLESAGFAFKSSSMRDLLIKACVVERLYEPISIDEILEKENQPILFALDKPSNIE